MLESILHRRAEALEPAGVTIVKAHSLLANCMLAVLTYMGIGRVAAQEFPTRPISFIVPNLPGGSSDLIARAIGARLQVILGQPVVVDNKPGASELIGTDLVVRAPPDGYTIAILSNALSINETLSPNRTYVAERDLLAVAKLVELPFALIVSAAVPAKSLQEFIAHAKANPGKLSYGHVGHGAPHYLTMEWFKRAAGLDIVDIPYRSSPPVYAALLGGEIQLTVGALGGATQLIESGKLKALASMSKRRPVSQPDLPSITEFGFAEFDLVPWMGVFVPAKTPAAVVRKLETELLAAAQDSEVKDRLMKVGLEPSAAGASEFSSLVKRDIANWAKIVRDVGVKPQ